MEGDAIPGHDQDHKDVTCAACHDAAGWEVGFAEEMGVFTTFGLWTHEYTTGEGETSSTSGQVPFSSHDLILEVSCSRCHFSGNQWGLSAEVEGQ